MTSTSFLLAFVNLACWIAVRDLGRIARALEKRNERDGIPTKDDSP